MIPKECKRLAEVDFPIAVVSKPLREERLSGTGIHCVSTMLTTHSLDVWDEVCCELEGH